MQRMKSVGIKILNSRLSEYVRLAASGETVLVTDRDRVVAEIRATARNQEPYSCRRAPSRGGAQGLVDAPGAARWGASSTGTGGTTPRPSR